MSNATFTKTALTNDRYLVRGTDQFGTEGSVVLDGTEFNRLDRKDEHRQAHAEFDAAMDAFYAPVNAALEKLQAQHEDDLDPLTFVIERDEVEAVVGVEEIKTILEPDTVVLRAVAVELFDRLVWVGDSLEVLAEDKAARKAKAETADADLANQIGSALAGIFGPDVQVTSVNLSDVLGGATDVADSNEQ